MKLSFISPILLISGRANAQKLAMSACIGTYPGYGGNIDVTDGSNIVVYFNDDDSLALTYNINGAESNCYDCGIHIHEGMNCDNKDEVGGHHWDSKNGTIPDPWTPAYRAVYNTNAEGRARGRIRLDTGYNYNENLGRVAVIHAQNGTRIGCGVLNKGRRNAKTCDMPKQKILQTCIKPYLGYKGHFTRVKGKVVATYGHEGYSFKWRISNGDTDCDVCRICISSGLSCDDTDVEVARRHLETQDCIVDEIYSTNTTGKGNGFEAISGSSNLISNFTGNTGDIVIIHDSNGMRYGCGVLGTNPVSGCMKPLSL